MEGIARAGMGEPFIMTDPIQATEQVARFRRMVESPVLTSVKAQFEGLDVYDVEPAALRSLWARHRIASLSDQETLEGGDTFKQRITDLGLQYSLLTQYTSFIAVDQVVRNSAPQTSVSVNQPAPLPKGVSDLAVGGATLGAEVLSTPEPETLGAIAVARTGLGVLSALPPLAASLLAVLALACGLIAFLPKRIAALPIAGLAAAGPRLRCHRPGHGHGTTDCNDRRVGTAL